MTDASAMTPTPEEPTMPTDPPPALCHRMPRDNNGPGCGGFHECVGSRCALWVPEVTSSSMLDIRLPGPGCYRETTDRNYNRTRECATPTGRGWCADNLRREPWTDTNGATGAE